MQAVALIDEDDEQTKGSYYGIVVKLYSGGKMLNELLRVKHAVIYARFCNDCEFVSEGWTAKYGC